MDELNMDCQDVEKFYQKKEVTPFFALCFYCPKCGKMVAHNYLVIKKFPYETNCRCGQEVNLRTPLNMRGYFTNSRRKVDSIYTV